MKTNMRLKKVVACLVAAGALALSANAQAITIDAGIFDTTLGHVGNPVVVNVNPVSGLFLDTINFDLGSFTHFNMTSTISSEIITTPPFAFGVPIFENNGDTEFVLASANHFSVFLPDLELDRDYHLHPQGGNTGGGSYQITMWGSTAPVPVPAAAWLFGTGLAAMVGLARRKMSPMA